MLLPTQPTLNTDIIDLTREQYLEFRSNLIDLLGISTSCPIAEAFIDKYASVDDETVHFLFFSMPILGIDECSYLALALNLMNLDENKMLSITFNTGAFTFSVYVNEDPNKEVHLYDGINIIYDYYSKALNYVTGEESSLLANKVIIPVVMPYLCPYIKISQSEYCPLVTRYILQSKNNVTNNSCPALEGTSVYYSYSFDDFTNESVVTETFHMCLQEYKRLTLTLTSNAHGSVSYTVKGIVSLISSSVSMVCILITFGLYYRLLKLRNIPMILFGIALCNLFIAQAVFQFGSVWTDEGLLCTSMGISIHFIWLAATFSLNAYCIVILRNLQSINNKTQYRDILSIFAYVYGLPVILVLTNIIYTNVQSSQDFSLGYGAGLCHINTTLMRGLLFGLPIFLAVVCNCVVYFAILYKIKRITSAVHAQRGNMFYAPVYFRLLLVSGITWTFGFINEFIHSIVLDYFFIVLVAGQGLLLLLSFGCSKQIRERIGQSFCSRTPTTS